MATEPTRLRNCGHGVYEVRSRATGTLLGRVIRDGEEWRAYVIRTHGSLGAFPSQRDAVAEVWIEREQE